MASWQERVAWCRSSSADLMPYWNCGAPPLPANAALAREHRMIEEAISLGEFERAQKAVLGLLSQDSMNARTIQLFAEVQRALNSADPIKDFLRRHTSQINTLPPLVLTQLADVLTLADSPSGEDLSLARGLYLEASKGRFAEREIRQVAVGLSRAGDDSAALQFLDRQFDEHPDLKDNPWLLRIRGNALIGQAKHCSQTGKRRDLPPKTKGRAWEDCRRFLRSAERDLRRAISLTTDSVLIDGIEKNLDFVEQLKRIATPPERQRTGSPKNGN
jgi:hypothetical protein